MLDQARVPRPPSQARFQHTCVFLLLFNKSEPHILAILKADNEGYPWRNQVALPGGHIDPSDASAVEAAFRELKEELAIPRKQVDLVGSMGCFPTINHKVIEVFIGLWDGVGPVRYDAREIARVLEIPMRVLMDTHRSNNYSAQPNNNWREITYPVDDLTIWGATARILHYFIELLLARPGFTLDALIF